MKHMVLVCGDDPAELTPKEGAVVGKAREASVGGDGGSRDPTPRRPAPAGRRRHNCALSRWRGCAEVATLIYQRVDAATEVSAALASVEALPERR
jgi:hypothetical protein